MQESSYQPTYICNKCDILLEDGVEYQYCPKCDDQVDHVDLSKDVYACPKCDFMINRNIAKQEVRKLRCKNCDNIRLTRIPGSGVEIESWKKKGAHEYLFDRLRSDFATYILPSAAILLLGFLILLSSQKTLVTSNVGPHPILVLMIFFLPLFLAVLFGLTNASQEILSSLGFLSIIFSKDRSRLIVNHGLEHATINILLENKLPVFGGRANTDGFRINTPIDPINIGIAFNEATTRIKAGETDLTVSPRCGTTIGVIGLIYISSLVSVFALWYFEHLQIIQAYGLLILILFVFYFFRYPLSILFQKIFTVSPVFAEADVEDISTVQKYKREYNRTFYVGINVTI